MVIDELPQWFERLFVFFALIMMLGICNACWYLGGIHSQLENLGRYLDGRDIKDIADNINKVRYELHDIRSAFGHKQPPGSK